MLKNAYQGGLGDDLFGILETTRLRIGVERVLITDVTADTQFVVAEAGLPLPETFQLSMPLSHSICQHVVGMRFPLVIEDAMLHPLLTGSKALTDLGIGAYLGQPFGEDFPSLAMCALSSSNRNWSQEDRNALNAAVNWILRFQVEELKLRLAAVRLAAPPGG